MEAEAEAVPTTALMQQIPRQTTTARPEATTLVALAAERAALRVLRAALARAAAAVAEEEATAAPRGHPEARGVRAPHGQPPMFGMGLPTRVPRPQAAPEAEAAEAAVRGRVRHHMALRGRRMAPAAEAEAPEQVTEPVRQVLRVSLLFPTLPTSLLPMAP